MSVQQRCQLMKRSVQPVLRIRNTRWPFSKTLAEEQNRVQRHMLAHFVRVERLPYEDLANYNRRRMRIIGNLARSNGAWGVDHAKRISSWAEHLERPRNISSLAAQVYAWHGAAWLQERRESSGVMRPETRIAAGFMPKRWDESVEDA